MAFTSVTPRTPRWMLASNRGPHLNSRGRPSSQAPIARHAARRRCDRGRIDHRGAGFGARCAGLRRHTAAADVRQDDNAHQGAAAGLPHRAHRRRGALSGDRGRWGDRSVSAAGHDHGRAHHCVPSSAGRRRRGGDRDAGSWSVARRGAGRHPARPAARLHRQRNGHHHVVRWHHDRGRRRHRLLHRRAVADQSDAAGPAIC